MEGPLALYQVEERDALLHRFGELLEKDQRLEAAIVSGSIGRSAADRWSDVDIACVVSDGEDTSLVTADWVGRVYREETAVHHYEASFDSTRVRGFLFPNGLVLDMSFAPAADFAVWAPVTVLFDRTGRATELAAAPDQWNPSPDWQGAAGLAWHDIVHCATAIARDRPWQALFYLQRVRNRSLSLASERRGKDADEFKYVDDLPAADLDPLHASLVSDLDATSLVEALEVAANSFLAQLRHGDPDLADRLEPVILLYIAAVRDRAV